jgi:hypothetical protein
MSQNVDFSEFSVENCIVALTNNQFYMMSNFAKLNELLQVNNTKLDKIENLILNVAGRFVDLSDIVVGQNEDSPMESTATESTEAEPIPSTIIQETQNPPRKPFMERINDANIVEKENSETGEFVFKEVVVGKHGK